MEIDTYYLAEMQRRVWDFKDENYSRDDMMRMLEIIKDLEREIEENVRFDCGDDIV